MRNSQLQQCFVWNPEGSMMALWDRTHHFLNLNPMLKSQRFFSSFTRLSLVFSYASHFTCASYGKYFWILQFPTCSVILIKSWALINHLSLEDKERFSKLLVRENWKNTNFWENTACQLRNQNVRVLIYILYVWLCLRKNKLTFVMQ